MDSIEKIVEEMRSREDEYDYGTLSSFVAEWTDRIEAQMKKPVKGVYLRDDGIVVLCSYGHEKDARLFAAPPAPTVSEKYKSTIAELCDCIEDVMNGKGGWAWEEVIQDARNLLEAAPPAPAVPDGFLEMLDSAFESEIKRVSETECNSNVICRHFYEQMRGRLLDVLAEAPEREQT